jgi:hypothetical protein
VALCHGLTCWLRISEDMSKQRNFLTIACLGTAVCGRKKTRVLYVDTNRAFVFCSQLCPFDLIELASVVGIPALTHPHMLTIASASQGLSLSPAMESSCPKSMPLHVRALTRGFRLNCSRRETNLPSQAWPLLPHLSPTHHVKSPGGEPGFHLPFPCSNSWC